jgi:hypothetical protein
MENHTIANEKKIKYLQGQHTGVLILIAVCILYVVVWCISKMRIKKRWLIHRYKVDKKTFNKWLEFFCSDLIPDKKEYKRRRTISVPEYLAVSFRLGNPAHHPVLTKKDIVEQGEGTYYSLRESVKKYPAQFGLPSIKAYLSLKKFPPYISQRILERYG